VSWQLALANDGFIDKKYVSKYIKSIKIVAMLRLLFWMASVATGFSIRILLFGKMKLDHA